MIKKISIFLVVITLILTIVPVKTNAFDLRGDIKDQIEDKEKPAIVKDETVNKIGNLIIGLIKYAGIFISVGGLMILGIKYMAASLEEKAQYKETMVPYVIGAVILFAGSFIVEYIYKVVTGII